MSPAGAGLPVLRGCGPRRQKPLFQHESHPTWQVCWLPRVLSVRVPDTRGSASLPTAGARSSGGGGRWPASGGLVSSSAQGPGHTGRRVPPQWFQGPCGPPRPARWSLGVVSAPRCPTGGVLLGSDASVGLTVCKGAADAQ